MPADVITGMGVLEIKVSVDNLSNSVKKITVRILHNLLSLSRSRIFYAIMIEYKLYNIT